MNYILIGDFNNCNVSKSLKFIATGLGLVKSEKIEFKDEPQECELIADGKSQKKLRNILTILSGNTLSSNERINDVINSIIDDNFSGDNDTIIVNINDILNNLTTTYVLGNDVTITDLIFAAYIMIWVNKSSVEAKKLYRNCTAFYGLIKKSDNFKTSAPAVSQQRSADDPTQWKIVVGKVIEVWEHPNSDKLWCEKIDIGEPEPRQIGSGLRQYINKENFVNKLVLVLANMKPKALGGFDSHGMVVCASSENHSNVELLSPPAGAKVGDVATFEGLTGEPVDVLSTKKNFNAVVAVMDHLKTDVNRTVVFKSHKMLINGTPIVAPTLKNAHVG